MSFRTRAVYRDMSKVRVHIAISLDGYVAGPNQSRRTRSAREASSSTIGSSS